MSRVAIVAGVRIPIAETGRAYASVHPVDLLGSALADAVAASEVDDPERVRVMCCGGGIGNRTIFERA